MTDEQKKPEGNKSIAEGLTVQGFGGAVGVLWVLHQKANGHFYEAGFELALGTVISGVLYALYYLFAPRIMRWRRRV